MSGMVAGGTRASGAPRGARPTGPHPIPGLREVRRSRGMLGTELAARLGISSTYLNDIERGLVRLRWDLLERAARVLDVSPIEVAPASDPDLVALARALRQLRLESGRRGARISADLAREVIEHVMAIRALPRSEWRAMRDLAGLPPP